MCRGSRVNAEGSHTEPLPWVKLLNSVHWRREPSTLRLGARWDPLKPVLGTGQRQPPGHRCSWVTHALGRREGRRGAKGTCWCSLDPADRVTPSA